MSNYPRGRQGMGKVISPDELPKKRSPNEDVTKYKVVKKLTQQEKNNFGTIQLFCYILSVSCQVLYCIHYIWDYSSQQRIYYHLSSEVIILLIRFANEYYYGKLAFGDYMHHYSHLFATYLITLNCFEPFAYLLCHLQILHFPMLLWYYGVRQNCYTSNKTVQKLCHQLFPLMWLFCMMYRITSGLGGFGIALREYVLFHNRFTFMEHMARMAVLLFFPITLLVLDINWSKYFFPTMKYTLKLSLATALAVFAGCYCGLFVVSSPTLFVWQN